MYQRFSRVLLQNYFTKIYQIQKFSFDSQKGSKIKSNLKSELMRSQSLRIFLTDFNTNYIIIYLMPSRADGSFLRYHETGVRADQLCAAGRPDPETFLAPCHGGYSMSHKATVPSSPLSSYFFI